MNEKDLNILFDQAFANAQLIPQDSVPQDMQLVLYGLYKQATSQSTNQVYVQNPQDFKKRIQIQCLDATKTCDSRRC